MSWSGGTCPLATFSTCRLCSHWSETPSRWTKARFARAGTSVLGLSMPATFISAAADWTAWSAPETLGTYRRCEIATVFSSGLDARYFFSTDNRAAAAGFVSTHLAPFNSARVAAAVSRGWADKYLPFTITAQQYSSL